jgi:hypothetical protein
MPITATLPWSVRLTHTRSSIRPIRLTPLSRTRRASRAIDDRSVNQPALAHLLQGPHRICVPQDRAGRRVS